MGNSLSVSMSVCMYVLIFVAIACRYDMERWEVLLLVLSRQTSFWFTRNRRREKKQQQLEKFVQIEILRSHATQNQHEFYTQNTFYGYTLLRSHSRATGFCGWHLRLLFWWCENMNESQFELHHNNEPEGNYLCGFRFRILTFHVQRRRFYLAAIFVEEFQSKWIWIKFLNFFKLHEFRSVFSIFHAKNIQIRFWILIGFRLKLFEWTFWKTKKLQNWLDSEKYSKNGLFIRKLEKTRKKVLHSEQDETGEKTARRINRVNLGLNWINQRMSITTNRKKKSTEKSIKKIHHKRFNHQKNTYFSIDKSLNDDNLSSSMHFLNFAGQWMSNICFEPN